MDPQTNRRLSTASSADSLVLYLNGGPPPKSGDRTRKRRPRACPVLALLGLLVHFLAAGCGVVLSVIVVRFGLQVTTAGLQDLVARILVFIASCMGIFYVLMHISAAREIYVRSHENNQLFSFFTVAVAVIIMRLALPVWIAAVVLTALVAASKGFSLAEGVKGNVIWIQLGIAALGLLSLFVMIIITERTDRPFATSIFSKRSFIKGKDEPVTNRTDTFDMSISRQGLRNDEKNGSTVTHENVLTKKDTRDSAFDRATIVTPTSPEDDSPAPTVPALPNMPEWRQRRDHALRKTMRTDDVRIQSVPSPLTAVYGPSTVAPSRDSVKQHGSHFSWRPPTRDSTFSQQSQDMEDYHNNWPPQSIPLAPKSPNRASAPPPSEPPNVPLPPLMPLVEVPYSTETSHGIDTTEDDQDRDASKRSSEIVSPPLEKAEPTSMPDTVPASTSEEEASGTTAEDPLAEQGSRERSRSRGRRPALPSLEKLSARAAARHNRAESKARPTIIDIPTDEATKATSPISTPEEAVDCSEPIAEKPRETKPDFDDSGFESEDDDTGSEQNPRRSRRSLLRRSNTAGPRLVRNFSRPRVPSGLVRHRRPSDGNLPSLPLNMGRGSRRNNRRDSNAGSNFTAPVFSVAQQRRRSRSVPAVMRRRDEDEMEMEDMERSTVLEVDSEWGPQPSVPILKAAPTPTRKSTANSTRKPASVTSAQDAPKKPPPRLTPFPSAATSMAPEKKVKGLGQGSLRRLEARVDEWQNGMEAAQARIDARVAELQHERQMMEDLETKTSMDLQRQDSSHRGGGRPSTDRERGRQGNKLSRERSLTGRARRAAQNF